MCGLIIKLEIVWADIILKYDTAVSVEGKRCLVPSVLPDLKLMQTTSAPGLGEKAEFCTFSPYSSLHPGRVFLSQICGVSFICFFCCYYYCYFYFGGTGVDFRASYLLGRHFTT
jgi:hypothetical protein